MYSEVILVLRCATFKLLQLVCADVGYCMYSLILITVIVMYDESADVTRNG